MPRRSPGVPEPAQPSALDELLETEREIAAADAAAASEAQSLIDAARVVAAENERQAAIALESELEELDANARANEAAAVSALEREAADRAARYRSLGTSDIARLATFVVDQVTDVSADAIP